jgi:hypothetical protein
MTLTTHDARDPHDAATNHELSIAELDTIAAGLSWRGIYNFLKGEVTEHVNAYKTGASSLIDGTVSLFRDLF